MFVAFLEALRDKFVCGLRSESIKQKLLTEDNLMFSRAYETVVGMELEEDQIKVMRTEMVSVNKLKFQHGHKSKEITNQTRRTTQNQTREPRNQQTNYSQQFNPRCKRCLRVHIDNNHCPAINWKCFACNKMEIAAKLCRNNIHKLKIEKESVENVNSSIEEELLKLE